MAASLSPRGRRITPGLLLIPLVDVIFLLLTFFMLASRIDPFSLLTLNEYQSRAEGRPAPGAAPAVPDLIVAVARGAVQANGETVTLADFGVRAQALQDLGMENVIVFTRPEATVQDVVSVLDALKKASFRSVVIRGATGAQKG